MSSPLFSKGNVSVLSKCIQEEYDRNKLYIGSIYSRYIRNNMTNRIKARLYTLYGEAAFDTGFMFRYVYFDTLDHLHSS